MATEAEIKKAREMYDMLCEAMKKQDWRFDAHDDELVINFTVRGDDIPMSFVAFIDAERKLVRLFSRLPFKIPAERMMDGAIATCHANYNLIDGSFDYDVSDGTIDFRMTAGYREAVVSHDLFLYMVNYACDAVDEYNDKFLMLAKGAMSLEDFLKIE